MDKSMRQLVNESYDSCERSQEANRKEFMEMADDWFPYGWSTSGGMHLPGTRGGHISFGGL
jgi:hypothetical protein